MPSSISLSWAGSLYEIQPEELLPSTPVASRRAWFILDKKRDTRTFDRYREVLLTHLRSPSCVGRSPSIQQLSIAGRAALPHPAACPDGASEVTIDMYQVYMLSLATSTSASPTQVGCLYKDLTSIYTYHITSKHCIHNIPTPLLIHPYRC